MDGKIGFHLHPPLGKKRGPGRQKKLRIKGAAEGGGKATRQVKCQGCGESGHKQGSWRCHLTGTNKRKRTKKSTVKAGRKKTKKGDIPAPEHATPRTRARVAKEAAIMARLEAEQAEARARAALKDAEAASRALDRVIPDEPGPLVALPAPITPSGPMTRRRLSMAADQVGPSVSHEVGLAPAKKMTPRKKQVASKIKKKMTSNN